MLGMTKTTYLLLFLLSVLHFIKIDLQKKGEDERRFFQFFFLYAGKIKYVKDFHRILF